jgi:hypothetical protein
MLLIDTSDGLPSPFIVLLPILSAHSIRRNIQVVLSSISVRMKILLAALLVVLVEQVAHAFPIVRSPVSVRISSSTSTTTNREGRSLTRQYHAPVSLDDWMILPSPAEHLSSVSSSSCWIADSTEAILPAASSGSTSAAGAVANDPLVLMALGVAMLALAGVVALSSSAEEEETNPTDPSKDESSKVASNANANKIAETEEEQDEGNTNSFENADAEDDILAFRGDRYAQDDEWVQQGREAMKALDTQDRGKLRGVVRGLLGSIRSTGTALGRERTLKEAAEAEMKVVGENFRDLEDQYELEQNQLQKTTNALTETKSQLTTTIRTLDETANSLTQLQEERKSLRKLGKVAWGLSKDRVKNRLQKVRGRFRPRDTNDDE